MIFIGSFIKISKLNFGTSMSEALQLVINTFRLSHISFLSFEMASRKTVNYKYKNVHLHKSCEFWWLWYYDLGKNFFTSFYKIKKYNCNLLHDNLKSSKKWAEKDCTKLAWNKLSCSQYSQHFRGFLPLWSAAKLIFSVFTAFLSTNWAAKI